MSVGRMFPLAAAALLLLGGCANFNGETIFADALGGNAGMEAPAGDLPPVIVNDGYPVPVAAPAGPIVDEAGHGDVAVAVKTAWGEPAMPPVEVAGTHAVAASDGPYLLDSGDRMRIFVYGQPNLSRLYIVDHDGKISVPLIGEVTARGKTTTELQSLIRSRLGAQYVKDPQVTVDIQQNRPFFILGEVKTAGQYPYVSGMTVETAVAIAGGYTERASERKFRITRRINGFVDQIEAPGDYPVKPGDTIYVFERYF